MGIRRALESDLEAIHPLLEQLMRAPAHRRLTMWNEALKHQGYAAHGNNVGVVNNLGIDKRFRGRGLGENLLRAAIDHSERRDAVELYVWTEFDNSGAIALYKKLGFAERAVLLEREVGPEGTF